MPCLLNLGQQLPASSGSPVYHHFCKPHPQDFTGNKCGCVISSSLCIIEKWDDPNQYPISLENIKPDYQEEAKEPKRGRWQHYPQNSGVPAVSQSKTRISEPELSQPKRVTSFSLISLASLARLVGLTKSAPKLAAKVVAKMAAKLARVLDTKLDWKMDQKVDSRADANCGNQSARSDSEATIGSANQRTAIRWTRLWTTGRRIN